MRTVTGFASTAIFPASVKCEGESEDSLGVAVSLLLSLDSLGVAVSLLLLLDSLGVAVSLLLLLLLLFDWKEINRVVSRGGSRAIFLGFTSFISLTVRRTRRPYSARSRSWTVINDWEG